MPTNDLMLVLKLVGAASIIVAVFYGMNSARERDDYKDQLNALQNMLGVKIVPRHSIWSIPLEGFEPYKSDSKYLILKTKS